MKVSINDKHTDFVFLSPEETFHDLSLDGVGWRNLDVFLKLLDFYTENPDEFASWIKTGWFSNTNVKEDVAKKLEYLLSKIGE